MPNNVYIGSRYVPVFDGAWDNTKSYGPLTIVEYGNNTYTSKRPVPVGTLPTDTSYWALTGNYNGQITHLQDQIDDNTSDITALQNSKGKKRYAVYLGNSYAGGIGSTSGNDGLYKKTKDLFDDSYLYALGGVGFLPWTNHSDTFVSMLNSVIANPGISHDDITDIIVIAAMGDGQALREASNLSSYISALETALDTFVANAKAAYPNLIQIRVAFAEIRTHSLITTQTGTSPYNIPFEIHAIFNAVLKRHGLDYLGWVGWSAMMRDGMASSDYYHPSDLGYTEIASNLRNALNGGFQYIVKNAVYTVPCNVTTDSNIEVEINMTPDNFEIQFNNGICEAGTTTTQYDEILLADMSTPFNNNLLTIPAMFGRTFKMGNIHYNYGLTISECLSYRAYLKPVSNGQASIYGQAFEAAITVPRKLNRGIIENYHKISAIL